MEIKLRDFQPINQWEPDHNGPKWCGGQLPRYLIDCSTNHRYWNESKASVGFKCFLLAIGTPFVHGVAGILNIALRIVKLTTFANFWMAKENETQYNFKARLLDASLDLLRIVTQSFAIVGLELASIYGCFRPYDGRKLYATLERAQYGSPVLAPCFQPDPQSHLLGGDPNQRDAF